MLQDIECTALAILLHYVVLVPFTVMCVDTFFMAIPVFEDNIAVNSNKNMEDGFENIDNQEQEIKKKEKKKIQRKKILVFLALSLGESLLL